MRSKEETEDELGGKELLLKRIGRRRKKSQENLGELGSLAKGAIGDIEQEVE